jgi:1,2-dihydroxy-3-keto-5-methylthiopentene dioxygenase
MGPEPYFIAIRLFTNVEGWVATFTGSDIAQKFPRYENGQAA